MSKWWREGCERAAAELGVRSLMPQLVPEELDVDASLQMAVLGGLTYRLSGEYRGYLIEAGAVYRGEGEGGTLGRIVAAVEVLGLPSGFAMKRAKPGSDWWRSRRTSPWRILQCPGGEPIKVRANDDAERDRCVEQVSDDLCSLETEIRTRDVVSYLWSKESLSTPNRGDTVVELVRRAVVELVKRVVAEAKAFEQALDA